MQWLSFTKVEKVMLKLQKGRIWTVQWCGRSWKRIQETGNTFNRPGRGRKQSVRSLQLFKNERKAATKATKPSPKLHNLGHRNRCEQIHHAPGVEGQSGVKPFKMLHRRELTANHVVMRVQKCKEILQEMADGTLPYLVFTDERNSTSRRW